MRPGASYMAFSPLTSDTLAVSASESGHQPGAHPCRVLGRGWELPHEWFVIDFFVVLIVFRLRHLDPVVSVLF
jgi:hypothetical protein